MGTKALFIQVITLCSYLTFHYSDAWSWCLTSSASTTNKRIGNSPAHYKNIISSRFSSSKRSGDETLLKSRDDGSLCRRKFLMFQSTATVAFSSTFALATEEEEKEGEVMVIQQPNEIIKVTESENRIDTRETVLERQEMKEVIGKEQQTDNTLNKGSDDTAKVSYEGERVNDIKEQQQAIASESEKMALIEQEEKEIIQELKTEEKDEEQAKKDTQKLITDLEEQISIESNNNKNKASISKEDEENQKAAMQNLMQDKKELIETLEKEEERIENETKILIDKIETLEKQEFGESPAPQQTQQQEIETAVEKKTSDVPSNLETKPAEAQSQTPITPSVQEEQKQTQEFVNKLKERVEEKEDLISRLKRESQKDIDPKTGKFRYMSKNDFRGRAPSDFDFLSFLKETLENTDEFERDLEAFEGLLESKFESLVDLAGKKK